MNNECLVSICCLTYNHERFLRDTLEGFLAQKVDFPFEILINDDASTDGTASIVREYAARYPELIRPFYQPVNLYSQGKDLCLEALYPNARGKYIALCEGDDYWIDETKLQRQADFMEAHPEYSACAHNTMLHFCSEDRADEPLLKSEGDRDVRMVDVLNGMGYAFHTSSLFAKREIIANPLPFFYVGLSYGFGDQPDAMGLMLKGPVRLLDRCMSVYRIHSNQASWSSAVARQYSELRRFVHGQGELLRAFRPYAPVEVQPKVNEAILGKEFELMYIEGRDREQRKPPYDKLLRAMPLKYRAVNLLKCCFPRLLALYRRRRGYTENEE